MSKNGSMDELFDSLALDRGSPGADYLVSLNPYLKALLNPGKYSRIKYPDMSVYPSVNCVVQQTLTAQVNSSGVAMVIYGSGATSASLGSLLPFAPNYVAGAHCSTGSLASMLNGASDVSFPDWDADGSTPRRFNQIRLVSGAATGKIMSSSARSSGVMICGFVPKQIFDLKRGAGAVSWDMLTQFPLTKTVAVAADEYWTVRYRPADSSLGVYQDVTSTVSSTLLQGRYPGTFFFAVRDADPANVLQVSIQCNYEALPRYGQDMLFAEPSLYDPRSLANAENEFGDEDIITNNPKVAIMADAKSHGMFRTLGRNDGAAQDQRSTMFEKLFTDVDKWPTNPKLEARGKLVS